MILGRLVVDERIMEGKEHACWAHISELFLELLRSLLDCSQNHAYISSLVSLYSLHACLCRAEYEVFSP